MVDGLDALLAAARRLLELDPDAFAKVLAAAQAFVAIYDRPDEPEQIFACRIAQIRPRSRRWTS